MNRRLLAAALILAPLQAHALGEGEFVNGMTLDALTAITAQIRQVIKEPQNQQQIPLVIPVVDFGNKRAARYRYRRKDEIFSLDGAKRPVPVGWEMSEVLETSGGQVERLIAVEPAGGGEGNKDYQAEKRKVGAEPARLAKLLSDADERAKLQKKQKSDEDALVKMVNEFPRALQYKFEGIERDAEGVEIARESFTSNDCSHTPHVDPCFTPKSQEARIFEGMKGMIWVRVRDKHLVRFETVIDHDVKFGWGIFSAKAKKGGSIAITLTDIDGSGKRWIISALEDHITITKSAMASLFSGGDERDNDNQRMSGFQQVADMSFDQGVELLRR
ncbi:MAG TPA: hypothetical protein VN915_06895 [Elusimicrobiota bacterium]|nr:hypothetical protein [Elusimicrobiota bacterium]